MRRLHLLLVSLLCLAFVLPADAWLRWRMGSPHPSDNPCIFFGLRCPTSPGGYVPPDMKEICAIKKSTCKRNLLDEEEDLDARNIVKVPFDADFDDYDDDKDGFISYEEFFDTVNNNVPLENPFEVDEPFSKTDTDGDGKLSEDEFAVAPLDFGDAK